MVSLFPELLSFGLLAPLILRLVVGFFFAFEAWELIARARHHATQKSIGEPSEDTQSTTPLSPTEQSPTGFWIRLFAIAQFITGGLLVIGAFTQAAALSAMLLSFIMLRLAPHALYAPHERLIYKMLFFVALALVFLGAGAFGFDFPL